MDFNGICSGLSEELEKVAKELEKHINSSNSSSVFNTGGMKSPISCWRDSTKRTVQEELIKPLKKYILETKGKMLRPSLMLLSSKSVEPLLQEPKAPLNNVTSSQQHINPRTEVGGLYYGGIASKGAVQNSGLIKLAAAVELIHTASLLHDDVLDNGQIRRHRITVNKKWGNRTAILFGDYLYASAFSILADYPEINSLLSKVIANMCEGEIIQNLRAGDFNMTESAYIEIIAKKSASLLEAACRIGAIAAKADAGQEKALSSYGYNLGIAYQIFDDLIDVIGSEDDIGKTLGNDMQQGKVTLYLITSSNPDFARLSSKEVSVKVFNKMCGYLEKAGNSLDIIPGSVYKNDLIEMLSIFKQKAGEMVNSKGIFNVLNMSRKEPDNSSSEQRITA